MKKGFLPIIAVFCLLVPKELNGSVDRLRGRRCRKTDFVANITRAAADRANEFRPTRFDATNQFAHTTFPL